MSRFTDAEGRTWSLTINVRTVKELKEVGIDITKPQDGSFDLLADDLYLLAESIWCLCKRQAGERGITEESFYEALHGDAIEDAANAFIEAVICFFPKSRQAILRRVMASAQDQAKTAELEMTKRLETFLNTATDTPESSD